MTVSSVLKEKEYILENDRDRYVKINDDKVSKFIVNDQVRYQILHNAFVYVFDTVCLVVGDKQSQVINGTVVDFFSPASEFIRKSFARLKIFRS